MSSIPFRILIAHSRSFNDADLLKRKADYFLSYQTHHEVCMITQTGSLVPGYMKDKVFVSDWNSWAQQAPVKAYEQALIYCDAVLVFWDGESFNEKELIRMCKELPRKHVVVPFKSVKQEIEEAIESQPKKRKLHAPMILSETSKQRFRDAHASCKLLNTPNAVKDFGALKCIIPVIRNANGLNSFIVKFLDYSQQYGNRVNTTGRKIMVDNEEKWIPGTTKTGTGDTVNCVNGYYVIFETKIRGDKPSKDQLKQKRKIEAAGGYYFFTGTPEIFFTQYDFIMSLPRK